MNNGDSSGYYMHLVSSVINQDIGDYTKTIDDFLINYPNAADPRQDKFGVRKTAHGKSYIKYTLGVGLMELPAMLIAHPIAKLSKKYKPDGWSLPYVVAVNFSKIIYITFGFFFLIKVLLNFYDNKTVLITTLSIAFATNLFYHGIFLSLAHSFLFFDLCLLIYLSKKFHESPTNKRAFGIGLLVGLITLTRVPEIVALLIPLLWGVSTVQDFKSRVGFFKTNSSYLLIAALGLILVFSPQIIYWKFVSNQFFFNPYQGESFNFLKPKIHQGWFNLRNGWLIYTPIMIFSLIGFYHLKEKAKDTLLPSILFTLLIAWIHYSYYVWNYYPGMGSRPMIECYPILSFPLAAFYKKIKSKWIPITILISFSLLNIFQTWQMHKGLIFTQNGSPAFYKESFGKTRSTKTALQTYDAKRAQPKISNLTLIDTLLFDDFEKENSSHVNTEVKHSGQQSLNTENTSLLAERMINIFSTELKANDWVYVGIKAFRKTEDQVSPRYTLEELFCLIEDGNGKRKKTSGIKIASHLGNKDNNIFYLGTPEIWDEAGFFFRISNKVEDDWKLRVYVRNLNNHKLYIDDLIVLHYR